MWGAVLGVVVLLFMGISQGGLWYAMSYLEDDSSLVIVIISAVIVCAVSVVLERLCAAINAFLSSFIIVLVVMMLFAEDIDSLDGLILITTLICAGIAFAAYIYYNYAFIIVTAFSGAYIATIAGIGLYYNTDFSSVVTQLVFNQDSEVLTVVYGITIVLGACGFLAQYQRLKTIEDGTATISGVNPTTAFLKDSINVENMGNTAEKLVEQVKNAGSRAGETSGPVLKDMGTQFKDAWSEIKSDQGRSDLKDSIMENQLLFIPTIVNSIILPLLYLIANSVYISAFYTFLYWVGVIASGMTIGILVYLVISKDLKLNLVYLLPYTLGYIVFYFKDFQYYGGFSLFMCIFRYVILWGVLYFVCKMISKDNVKPIVLSILAFFVDQYLIDWISYQYLSFYVNVYAILQLVIIVGTIYFLFKKYHNINIFDFFVMSKNSVRNQNTTTSSQNYTQNAQYRQNTLNSSSLHTDKQGTVASNISETQKKENSQKIKKCPSCQQIYPSASRFCRTCGTKLNYICPNCGNIVNEDAAFCKQCGTPL